MAFCLCSWVLDGFKSTVSKYRRYYYEEYLAIYCSNIQINSYVTSIFIIIFDYKSGYNNDLCVHSAIYKMLTTSTKFMKAIVIYHVENSWVWKIVWPKEMRDNINNCNWMRQVQKRVAKGAIILNSPLWDLSRWPLQIYKDIYHTIVVVS